MSKLVNEAKQAILLIDFKNSRRFYNYSLLFFKKVYLPEDKEMT